MKQKWSGQVYKDMLWKCASSTTVQWFNKAMDDLKNYKKEAYEWLCKIPPHHWSRSHFSGKIIFNKLLGPICSKRVYEQICFSICYR